MPKVAYQSQDFRADTLALIEQVNTICQSYAAQGYGLTLRGLYYQLVTQNVIENSQRSYKRLGNVVNDARLAGLVDWNHIMDSGRNVHSPAFWSSPQSVIQAAADGYNIEMWASQPEYVEVWVEKEALANVISRAADRRDGTYFACKGYTSQSEMWAAAMRLKRHERRGQRTTVIHLGDHDPSGLDMTRDIRERLELFGSSAEVKRIALNMDQIEQYQPPPNPAKVTDSRFEGYMEEFGQDSWELDALPPNVLDALVTAEVDAHIDMRIWRADQARLREERVALTATADNWSDVLVDLRDRGHIGNGHEGDAELDEGDADEDDERDE